MNNWQETFPEENRYWTAKDGILYKGHVLDILRTLPDESIDCIITSPPYWGLRDFGEETNIIWDGDKRCKHEWKKYIGKKYSGEINDIFGQFKDDHTHFQVKSSSCKKCNAWYGQLGLESTLDLYLEHMLQITTELKRVLKRTGVMFWNHGDNYGGANSRASFGGRAGFGTPREGVFKNNIPQKCMAMQNYRLILQMIDKQGWILRNIIIWHKPNHMPSSAKDRFTNAYEPVFMLTKNKKYWFDLDAVRVPQKKFIQRRKRHKSHLTKESSDSKNGGKTFKKGGWSDYLAEKGENYNPLGKNPGNVWTIPTQPFPEAHFATFPSKLIVPMIKAGCPYSGIILDPFMGAGTTGLVARRLGRYWIGIELNEKYCEMARRRIEKEPTQLSIHL